MEIPNPPVDNEELRKLLLPTEAQPSLEIKQKQENIDQQTTPLGLKDKLSGSYSGNMNQSQSLSDTTSQANSLTPIQNMNGLNKSPLTSDTGQGQFQQVFMFPANFGNNQNPQMNQNIGMNMQQTQQGAQQTRYEVRNEGFNTMNFVPQQQTYMVYQGNMQPFMLMNSQPMFQQQNNMQAVTFQQMSQPHFNEQNQKMRDFNEPAKIENSNQNSNVYIVNNQNSNDGNRGVQMNMYHSITPMNQMQYYMPPQTTTYFVGKDNNNNNVYQQIQQVQQVQQMQQMQPMMYVQSQPQQPNYYIQSFSATNDVYMPQQGGFIVFGDGQNQVERQGDLIKAKKENF